MGSRPLHSQGPTNGSPGEKTVYVKNPKYKPRAEPASGLAGGKIAKVDRVEWVAMSDQQTAVNALQAGEIDVIEQPQHDLYPILKKDRNVSLITTNKWGNQYIYRFNQLFKPFDNAKIRQAMLYALNQKDFLEGVIGDPEYYKVCKAMFMCGGPTRPPRASPTSTRALRQGQAADRGGRL